MNEVLRRGIVATLALVLVLVLFADVRAAPPEPESPEEASGSKSDAEELRERVAELTAEGIARFQDGDFDDALGAFKTVLQVDSSSTEARFYIYRVTEIRRQRSELETSAEESRADEERKAEDAGGVGVKLETIIIPEINFRNLPLERAVKTLQALSERYDPAETDPKGVTFTLSSASLKPQVNLTLRNLSLRRVLDFLVQQVDNGYEVKEDSVVIRPGSGRGVRETASFPVSADLIATVALFLDDMGWDDGKARARSKVAQDLDVDEKAGEEILKAYFESVGISFSQVPGAKLVLVKEEFTVTNTARNLAKIGDVLKRVRAHLRAPSPSPPAGQH